LSNLAGSAKSGMSKPVFIYTEIPPHHGQSYMGSSCFEGSAATNANVARLAAALQSVEQPCHRDFTQPITVPVPA
jgi:hypothetical protein